MKNKMVQMVGVRKMRFCECDMPTVGQGEVLVQIQYVGICGSDMHFFTEGHIRSKYVTEPFILGHEAAGIVVETGSGVQHLKKGDRVTLEPGIPCGTCEYCRSGRYNLCPDVQFLSVPPYDGALRKYMTVPAHMVFKLPDTVSTLEGAMVEPLSVGIHAARRGGVELGSTVCILGGGPIGMMTLLACKAMGAAEIIVTDLFDKRLRNARKLGATQTINSREQDAEKIIAEYTASRGVDIVIETAGSPVTMAQAPKLVKRGGVIVAVGNIAGKTPFEFLEIINREVDIRTVFRYCNIFPLAIESISSGKIQMGAISPTLFPLEKAEEAFLYTHENAQDIIKTIIQID